MNLKNYKDPFDADAQWTQHRSTCPTCRRHVSVEGLILREKRMCSKGRKLARAAWAMAEVAVIAKAEVA